MDKYRSIAMRALQIMSVEYNIDEDMEILVQRIRFAVRLPASATEKEIMDISKLIASKIEARNDISDIEALLDKLTFEVSFLVWD